MISRSRSRRRLRGLVEVCRAARLVCILETFWRWMALDGIVGSFTLMHCLPALLSIPLTLVACDKLYSTLCSPVAVIVAILPYSRLWRRTRTSFYHKLFPLKFPSFRVLSS